MRAHGVFAAFGRIEGSLEGTRAYVHMYQVGKYSYKYDPERRAQVNILRMHETFLGSSHTNFGSGSIFWSHIHSRKIVYVHEVTYSIVPESLDPVNERGDLNEARALHMAVTHLVRLGCSR